MDPSGGVYSLRPGPPKWGMRNAEGEELRRPLSPVPCPETSAFGMTAGKRILVFRSAFRIFILSSRSLSGVSKGRDPHLNWAGEVLRPCCAWAQDDSREAYPGVSLRIPHSAIRI